MYYKILTDFFNLFGDRFYLFAALFLIAAAIIGYLIFDVSKLMPLRQSLKTLNRRLTGRSGDIGSGSFVFFDKKVHEAIQSAWTAYCNKCKLAGNENGAPDIRDYFSQYNIITVAAQRKKAELVPGILSMTGIIAALLGMAAGLSNSGLHLDPNESGGLSGVLNVILSSISIYVVSLILSTLFQLLDRLLYHAAVMELNSFVSNIIPAVPAPEDATRILIGEQRGQREAIEKLGESISGHLNAFINKDLVPSIYKAFDESVKNKISPSIKAMSDMICQLSETALTTQKKGMQIMADNFANHLITGTGMEFEKLAGGLRGILENKVKQDDATSRLLQILSENTDLQKQANTGITGLIGIIGSYHREAVKLNALTADSMGSMKCFNNELKGLMESTRSIASELNAQRQSMRQESSDYFEKLNGHAQKMFEDLNIQLDTAFERFNVITQSAFDRFDHTLNGLVEGVSSNIRTIMDNMDDQVRDISIYAKGISEEVGELNDRLENSVKEFGEQMKTGVVLTMDAFDNGLGEICSRFGRTIADMKDAVEDMPGIIRSIRKENGAKQEMAV